VLKVDLTATPSEQRGNDQDALLQVRTSGEASDASCEWRRIRSVKEQFSDSCFLCQRRMRIAAIVPIAKMKVCKAALYVPPPVAVSTSMKHMNKTYASRYVSRLSAKELARLSLLVRCKAIQYDFQNPRVRIDIAV
jgi:hypothetical protein